MIVGDLLELDGLGIRAAWATPELLRRTVAGVTSTDLQDPARYPQPGEVVLTGLVWWNPADTSAALRFATSLRSAGVAALLAGEGTHGTVPEALAAACRTHRIPLLSVPAGTSFRAVTDRIYLRLWGDLQASSQGTAAVPEGVRRELAALLQGDTPPQRLLDLASARLGLPDCSITTAGGRVLARSGADTAAEDGDTAWAVPIGARGGSPYEGWLLRPHERPAPAAATVLHGLADLLGPAAARAAAGAAARRGHAARLFEALAQDAPGPADALAACGLADAALTAVTARIDGAPAGWACAALAEALYGTGAPFAAAPDRRGGACALTPAAPAEAARALRAALPRLQARLSGRRTLRAGVGPAVPADGADALRGALVQAVYALESAPAGTVASSAETDSLAALLLGTPPEVRAAFHHRLLAPPAAHDRANAVSLLGTLDAFLAHDCSWTRTAEALHLHVNTVHYRLRRIEELTGRSLARLQDRLDLRAALLCAPVPAAGPAPTPAPRRGAAAAGARRR
ncbi:PucR family transcriptional regulator [Streptomyces sp. NRRL B-24484]|uniref:PucR family transcriptional regulator n=1 Tax=Streptomyces sp. NRRL B-24484 TaxID=1463833 RepID=UPI00069452D6|nr:PucR family transcriptional regulator [Streptomyces sp. NRRL B-24484]